MRQLASSGDWIPLLHLFWVPFICSLVMAALCGFIGSFVVLRRLSFLTDTLAHASTLGIGIALVLGVSMQLTLIPFGAALSCLLAWMAKEYRDNLVALTAVAFSVCLGAGILILSHYGTGNQELIHILFGDMLWLTSSDLLTLVGFGVPITVFLAWSRKRLALIFLSPELAESAGIPADHYERLFMIAIGVVIAICIKLVGVLLVTSLVTVPPLVAAYLARSFRAQLVLSPIVSLFCTLVGVVLSVSFDLPTGACIATSSGVLFLILAATKRRP